MATIENNIVKPFSLYFSLQDGNCGSEKPTIRYLSQMRGMYNNENAQKKMITDGDPLVYEFYELEIPETAGDLMFGTSKVYPGKVDNEYFMTKGHFHQIIDTSEIYYCIAGHGYMLMENPGGDWVAEEMKPGTAVYVPKRYAHRSINVGNTPLITFYVFRADAGHDYGTIETRGFRKLLVEIDGTPTIVDNPKWME